MLNLKTTSPRTLGDDSSDLVHEVIDRIGINAFALKIQGELLATDKTRPKWAQISEICDNILMLPRPV